MSSLTFPLLPTMFLVFCVIMVSCSSKSPPKLLREELILQKGLSLDKQAPSPLWSPEQRKSLSNYYFFLAEYDLLKKKNEEAYQFYQKAYDLDPSDALVSKLISVEASLGLEDEARKKLKKLAVLYPESYRIRSLYSYLLAKQGHTKEAIEQAEDALELSPRLEPLYIQLISMQKSLGNIDEALRLSFKMRSMIPHSSLALVFLSQLYIIKGDYHEAEKYAEKLCEGQETNMEFALIYVHILEVLGKGEKAGEIFEKIFLENPSIEELMARSIILFKTFGDLKSVLARLDNASKRSVKFNASIELQRIFIMWELNENKEALSLLQKLRQDDPDSAQTIYLLGLCYERLGQLDKAMEFFNQVTTESNFYTGAKSHVINIYMQRKELERALDVALRLLHFKRSTWENILQAAGVYSELKMYQSAIDLLERGYQTYPAKHKILFYLGVYQEKVGRLNDCMETMKKVLERDPENSSAYNYLGYLYAEQGIKLDEAERLVKTALSFKPNDPFYLDSLGWIYYKQGAFQEAIKYLFQALKVGDSEGVIAEHLADAYKALNLLDKAVFYYQKSSELYKEADDLERIRKKINECKKPV